MLSVDAETALFGVNHVLAAVPKPRRWTWRTSGRMQNERDRLRLEVLFPRLVGAAEDYFVKYLTRVLRPNLLAEIPPPSRPDGVTKQLRIAARNQPKLLEMWANDLGVDPKSLPSWAAFDVSRELRHVLIHRLGQWQPGLDPHPALEDRIARLGRNPATYRGRIPLSPADMDATASLVLELIREAESTFGRP